MTNMNDLYQQLTGVDIEQQHHLWDERGKGYYGEYLLFRDLYPNVTGQCKILMNLRIPTYSGHTTEIDLLLIHETGLYVFEVKHFKGTIYGKSSDRNWTQYFRTAPNSHFYNPIAQNQYHIHALARRYPGVPIKSFIVFTSAECDLRIENTLENVTVCKLQNLSKAFSSPALQRKVLDAEHIDAMFNELAVFSPLTAKPVDIDGKEISFNQYLSTIVEDFQKEKASLKNEHLQLTQKEQNKTRTTIILSACAVVMCIVMCLFVSCQYNKRANAQIDIAQQELESFAQKFERVEDFNNGELAISKDILTVSNVILEASQDLENTVLFSCSLEYNGSDYGVSIGKDAVLIMVLKDGSVKECPVYNTQYPYTSDFRLGNSNSAWYTAHSTGEILRHEFYNISVEDVLYIKLSNVDVWTEVRNKPEIVLNGFEIELYQAD